MLLCNSYDLTKTCAISAGGRTVIIVLLQPDAFAVEVRVIAFAVAVCFCSYRRCYTHAKAFSLEIIVLFPNQNTIAKVAEKGKRVAVTCSSRPGDKPCFFLTNLVFHCHCLWWCILILRDLGKMLQGFLYFMLEAIVDKPVLRNFPWEKRFIRQQLVAYQAQYGGWCMD